LRGRGLRWWCWFFRLAGGGFGQNRGLGALFRGGFPSVASALDFFTASACLGEPCAEFGA
jgi:hypothetical protein